MTIKIDPDQPFIEQLNNIISITTNNGAMEEKNKIATDILSIITNGWDEPKDIVLGDIKIYCHRLQRDYRKYNIEE